MNNLVMLFQVLPGNGQQFLHLQHISTAEMTARFNGERQKIL